MIPTKALEIVDNIIRDCCKLENIPFAGKLVILGRDFRQTLSVIKYGTKFTIKYSDLWTNFKVLKL